MISREIGAFSIYKHEQTKKKYSGAGVIKFTDLKIMTLN